MDETPRLIPRNKQMSMSFATPFQENMTLEDRVEQLEYRINAFQYTLDSIQVDDNSYRWSDIYKRIANIEKKTRDVQRNLPEKLLVTEKKSEDLEVSIAEMQPLSSLQLELATFHDTIESEKRNSSIKQQLMAKLDQLQNSMNYLESDIFHQRDEIEDLKYRI
jgi:outer membrane murein-binding lipoprotein Lpp